MEIGEIAVVVVGVLMVLVLVLVLGFVLVLVLVVLVMERVLVRQYVQLPRSDSGCMPGGVLPCNTPTQSVVSQMVPCLRHVL